MSKSKGTTNIEQRILSIEGIKNSEGLNQARQHFDIGHSLFLVRYSFFKFKFKNNKKTG